MKDDYLWDKTGEPDPEIQKLEQILGTLRYQPRPLELPPELPARRRYYFPLLAIAASVLLALIAAGVWLRVRNQSEAQPREARVVPAPASADEKTPEQQTATVDPTIYKPSPRKEAPGITYRRRNRTVARSLPKREQEEAQAAKQQLMLALRLTSEKLNLVQRKTQTPTPPNQIKNQHRVG